jgi:hypothetical protein
MVHGEIGFKDTRWTELAYFILLLYLTGWTSWGRTYNI